MRERRPESPWNPLHPTSITPEGFERLVLEWLRRASAVQPSIELSPQVRVAGSVGEYAIDVVVRLTTFGGATIIVLVECKHQSRPVERDEVLILEGKLRECAAHKGILFSTSGFQSGALKYAEAHGIATITVVDGKWTYVTKSFDAAPAPPPEAGLPTFAGIRARSSPEGVTCQLVDDGHIDALREWLDVAE